MAPYPEGTVAEPGDNELRSLNKWAQLLFALVGNRVTFFPEGTEPFPFDDEERLEKKINRMLE